MILAAPSETWGFMRWLGGSGARSSSVAAFPSFIRLYLFCADPLQSDGERESTGGERTKEGRRRKRIFDEELGGDGGAGGRRAQRRQNVRDLSHRQDEGEGGRGRLAGIQMEEDGRVGESEREREDYKTRYFCNSGTRSPGS